MILLQKLNNELHIVGCSQFIRLLHTGDVPVDVTEAYACWLLDLEDVGLVVPRVRVADEVQVLAHADRAHLGDHARDAGAARPAVRPPDQRFRVSVAHRRDVPLEDVAVRVFDVYLARLVFKLIIIR